MLVFGDKVSLVVGGQVVEVGYSFTRIDYNRMVLLEKNIDNTIVKLRYNVSTKDIYDNYGSVRHINVTLEKEYK